MHQQQWTVINFVNVSNLELSDLKIQDCGITISNSTSGSGIYSTWGVKAAVYITSSVDINMWGVDILNSSGTGMLVLNSGGNVSMSLCSFKGNRLDLDGDHLYAGGGGLHIAFNSAAGSLSNYATFEIEMCNFDSNRASVPNVDSNGYARDKSLQFYGRGGGLFLAVRSNSSVSVRSCTFFNNTAVWGGGIAVFVLNRVRNTNVLFFNCTMASNRSPKFGGGGALVQYWTGFREVMKRNLILFENCLFSKNVAVLGGGLELIGGLLGPANETYIHFSDCTFSENRASFSAAVDVTQINQTSFKSTLAIEFTQCEFVGNLVIDEVEPLRGNYAIQVRSGIAAFTVLYLDVRFSRMVRFENNTGTALYVIAGVVTFQDQIEARFVNNSGHSGGAIALMVSALMFVKADSSLYFIRNKATGRGGAIFALNIGLHDLHKLVVTTCFIGQCGDFRDTVNFYFSGNEAGISGNSGNAIFSDNLEACYTLCNWPMKFSKESINNSINNLFSCFGNMHFCDGCQQPDCFHDCNSQPMGQIGGPAYRFETAADNTPIYAFPGLEFNLSVTVYDILDNTVNRSHYVAHLDDQLTAVHEGFEPEYKYVSNNRLQIDSAPYTNTTLVLHKMGLLDFNLRLHVVMKACPPGYSLNSINRCACVDEHEGSWYKGVLCNKRASVIHGKWIGYIGSEQPENLYTSICPSGYCYYNTTKTLFSSSYELPFNSSKLNEFLCSPTRQGRVCGECVPNTAVYYHSPQFRCRTDSDADCRLGWLWYILSELVPITAVYVVVMVLNISFTSGSVKGFIFFAQVIETLDINANGINGLNPTEKWLKIANDAHYFIYNAFNLEFFSTESLAFCLWRGTGTLDVLIVKYATMTYAFLLVLVTVLIFNRFQLCCKRAFSDKSYVIHGLSAFLITCYVQCMRVSFQILLPTHLSGLSTSYKRYSIVFYSGHLDFWKGRHLLYAIPALVCTVFIVILPPVALLIYPLYFKLFSICGIAESKAVKCLSLPFDKSKPFFDSFQSCYKNDFRFVAGLYFVYRITILLSYALSVGHNVFYLAVGMQLIVMTLLHCIMQPNRCNQHNLLDVLIFSNLSAKWTEPLPVWDKLSAQPLVKVEHESGRSYTANADFPPSSRRLGLHVHQSGQGSKRSCGA